MGFTDCCHSALRNNLFSARSWFHVILIDVTVCCRRKNREGRGSVSSSSDDDSYWGDGRTAVKYDRGSRRKLMDKSRKTDDRDIGYDDP